MGNDNDKVGAFTEFKTLTGALIYGGAPNLEMILQSGTQLSVLRADNGDQFAATILGLIINDYQNSLNLIRPIDAGQIADLSLELLKEYWGYRLEDFIAFFQLAKKGIYGRVLDRMDAPTIFDMLAKYDAWRIDQLRARATAKQEPKANLSPYAFADRQEQNGGFQDRGAAIGDFIGRIKGIKDKS